MLWEEAKGTAVLDRTYKRYCFSEDFVVVVALKHFCFLF